MAVREFIVGSRPQEEWGWLIIGYLFLAGVGAGLFFFALIIGLAAGMMIGIGVVLLGALLLLWHLSYRRAVWRVPYRPQDSWLSRGTIIILAFAALGFVHAATVASQYPWWTLTGKAWLTGQVWSGVLAAVAGVMALLVAAYPGFLLGSIRSIPFWNSAYLPALFLACGLNSGLELVYLMPVNWVQRPGTLAFLHSWSIGLIILTLLILFSLIFVGYSLTTRESVRLLTHGSLRYHFYIGVLGLGLILPLVVLVSLLLGAEAGAWFSVVGVLALVGGLMLRYVIVRAGVYVSIV